MRKLRLFPIVISVVITASVLFGGWFAYQSFAMESPFSQIISKTPGVEDSTIEFGKSQVNVKVIPKENASLREIYQYIEKEGRSLLGSRKLNVEVKGNDPSKELEQWWSRSLFDVAQAMETRHYGDIPAALEKHAAEMAGLNVKTEMDNKNVYITLTKGQESKNLILPRTSAKIGVWPNEQVQ